MLNVAFTGTTATINADAGDPESRTIRGTAVPWNQVGTVSDGSRVRFNPGFPRRRGDTDRDPRP